MLPSASAFTPLLPVSMSVAESLRGHGAPAVLITGRTKTQQRNLLPSSQLFYVNRQQAVVGGNLLDDRAVVFTPFKTNLTAVSCSELHPCSDAVVHLLLSSLGLVPDVVLYVSEQSRVQ